MNVYTTFQGASSRKDILVHLGDAPYVSANRIEGMFAHQHNVVLQPNGTVFVADVYGRPIKTISLTEHVGNFCAFASNVNIIELALNTHHPLTVRDTWQDDPIGSAGPTLIDRQATTPADVHAIEALFKPFTGIMQPWTINTTLSDSDVVSLHKRYKNNRYFNTALKGRKQRSQAIGEAWTHVKKQEIVWQHYTFLLRAWALNQGYDAFHYLNDKEGKGAHSYVTLTPNQGVPTGREWTFAAERYRAMAPNLIREAFRQKAIQHNNTGVSVTMHALWANQNPMLFFDAK